MSQIPPTRRDAAPSVAHARGHRREHAPGRHPFAEVTIPQHALSMAAPGSIKARLDLTLARDTYSGRIVGVVAGTRPRDANDIPVLFADRPDGDDPYRIGVARRGSALPNVLVVDHGLHFAPRHLHWAASHGICLRFEPAGAGRGSGVSRDDLRHLAAIRDAVGAGADVPATLGNWLKRDGAIHRHGEGDALADRWREGVARYPLRRPAPCGSRSS